VILHGADGPVVREQVDRAADEFLHPLRGVTLRSHPGLPDWNVVDGRSVLDGGTLRRPTPIESPSVTLHGAGLAFSALKLGADAAWTVARCVNVTDLPARGTWRFGRPVREAVLARLDETPGEPALIDGSAVRFVAPPRAVVTILVR
jgi:hypothetical protein